MLYIENVLRVRDAKVITDGFCEKGNRELDVLGTSYAWLRAFCMFGLVHLSLLFICSCEFTHSSGQHHEPNHGWFCRLYGSADEQRNEMATTLPQPAQRHR